MNNTISCPICGSKNLKELYSVTSSYVSNQLNLSQDHEKFIKFRSKIEQIWSAEHATYHTCMNCSFDFAYPFVAGDAELYSLLYHSSGQYPAEKWEYKITLNSIEKLIQSHPGSPCLFEIGAGNGSFLKLVMNIGIPAKHITATEYSEAGIIAIENLGIRCLNKDLNSITTEDIPHKIDIICLFQVLEHLTGIQNFFLKINSLTDIGARLYISVPNFYQRRFFDSFGYFLDLPPIHVARYNAKSLDQLAERFGWSLTQNIIQPTTYADRIKKFLYTRFEWYQRNFHSENIRIKIMRLFLRYLIYMFIVLINVRIVAGLRKSTLGTAQWFELVRVK